MTQWPTVPVIQLFFLALIHSFAYWPLQTNMEHIKQTFARCKREGRAAFVAYTTAGFPESADGVEVMLALEAGGAGKDLKQLW